MNIVSPNLSKFWDATNWFAFLSLLAGVSFVNTPYQSAQWLGASALFYALLASYILSVIFGGRCNRQAIYGARYAIALSVMSLLWLWLQTCLPLDNHLYERVFSERAATPWFNPDVYWSLTPGKTHWLLMSNALVITLFILAVCMLDSRRRVKQLLFVLMMVGSIHAIVGVLAKYAGLHLVDISELDGHYEAARGWFVNRNHFSSFISLCLVGALTYQLRELMNVLTKRLIPTVLDQIMSLRVIFMLSIILSTLAIILSQSRAGFLALVLSVAMVIFAVGKNSRHPLPYRPLVILGSLLVFSLLIYFGQELIGRFRGGVLGGGERVEQWLITWQAIKHQFFIGYGGGSYALVFQNFREYADLRQVVFDQAHNDFLHLWLEQGLIGLVFWLGFLYVSLRTALCSIQRSPSRLVVAVSFAGLMVVLAALVQAWVGYNLQIVTIRAYFFVIIALLFAAPNIKHRES